MILSEKATSSPSKEFDVFWATQELIFHGYITAYCCIFFLTLSWIEFGGALSELLVHDFWLEMSGEGTDGLYPICFGVSCTFFAFKLLSECNRKDENWCKARDRMLQGGAELLGLLIWKVQKDWQEGKSAEVVWKLECAEKVVQDLKKQRCEDAKANEKVASIYSTQEQTWFGERNKLRLQIGALLNQLSVFEKRRAECVDSLSAKIKDLKASLKSNEQMLEHEMNRNKELLEELRKVERSKEEHTAEAWKHKTAFVQLVSAHRQLEAELSRAVRQVEVGNAELSLILEQKAEAVSTAQNLSFEVANLRKEAELKNNARRQKHSLRRVWSKNQAKTSEVKVAEEQRHHLELDSFAEQMRLRDEKIEVLHRRLLRTELDFKKLQSHLEGLNQENARLRQMNLKLEEQLLHNKADLYYLTNRLASKSNSQLSISESEKEGHTTDGFETDEKEVITEQRITEKITNSVPKMDVRALEVFYKVKGLKQQLVMLERFTAHNMSSEGGTYSFLALVPLLNKQIGRYETLQARIDELYNKMNKEGDRNRGHAQPTPKKKTKEESNSLEGYLQEALQMQRYVVATGQKLKEIQTGINIMFCAAAVEAGRIFGIDTTRFGCSMRDGLKEVQKGLEVHSSRLIGDLEGTLACHGILHSSNFP